jgi:hypothetical protein
MSLEMAHKVILPPKKNYIPQFLKQRDINSYYASMIYAAPCVMFLMRAASITRASGRGLGPGNREFFG